MEWDWELISAPRATAGKPARGNNVQLYCRTEKALLMLMGCTSLDDWVLNQALKG